MTVSSPLLQRRLLVAHEAVVLFLRGLVADVAHLDHALRGDRAGTWRGPLLLDEWVVGLVLGVRPRVEQAEGGRVVVEGADVADERCRVHQGSRSFAENVISI